MRQFNVLKQNPNTLYYKCQRFTNEIHYVLKRKHEFIEKDKRKWDFPLPFILSKYSYFQFHQT